MINQVDIDEKSVSTIKFGNYDINIDLAAISRKTKEFSKDIDERNLFDLIGLIKSGVKNNRKFREIMLELHEKLSIPFACLALGVLAFPLGIQSVSLRRSSGFGFGKRAEQ